MAILTALRPLEAADTTADLIIRDTRLLDGSLFVGGVSSQRHRGHSLLKILASFKHSEWKECLHLVITVSTSCGVLSPFSDPQLVVNFFNGERHTGQEDESSPCCESRLQLWMREVHGKVDDNEEEDDEDDEDDANGVE